MIRGLLKTAARIRRLLLLSFFMIKRWGQPYFIHYTPDISGGVASWLDACTQAFYDYQHLIICVRGTQSHSAQRLSEKQNITLISHVNSSEASFFVNILPRPACVFNHGFWDLEPITKRTVRKKRVSIVVCMQNSDYLLKCASSDIDKVIVFSNYFKEIYENKFPANTEIAVIPYSLNGRKFLGIKPYRKKNEFVIGNITNGASWKHSDDFVSLCFNIGKKIPQATFKFLGAVDLCEYIVGQDKFEILKPFSVELINYLSQISILIHKTRSDFSETWGLVVTEAMCAGIPVVVQAKGGLKDQVIHGKTGFLAETNADFLHYCELLSRDEKLYEEIRLRARQYAIANFSLERLRARITASLPKKGK